MNNIRIYHADDLGIFVIKLYSEARLFLFMTFVSDCPLYFKVAIYPWQRERYTYLIPD